MSIYKHLLVGLDLTSESYLILNRAAEVAKQNKAKLTVVHIIEPLVFAYGGEAPLNLTETQNAMEEHAAAQLAKLVNEHHITTDAQIVSIGETAAELHALAESKDADLIVVGSHGRHGLALLFGSTATGVLHGAKCDVLTIRV